MIGHLDADCFYVSAERVRDAALIGKPVGVCGNQGACVIAKSYEMKKAGVKTGEPIWDALKKCPDGIYIKDSGRATRGLDRLAIRKDANNVVVNLDKAFQQDDDEAEWKTAFVSLT